MVSSYGEPISTGCSMNRIFDGHGSIEYGDERGWLHSPSINHKRSMLGGLTNWIAGLITYNSIYDSVRSGTD